MANEWFAAFISKIVSDGIDCTKDAIKDALKQKSKGYNTLHIQMYNVVLETMKDMASPYIKNDQEKMYDAAEMFLRCAKKENQTNLYKIKMCLKQILVSPSNENCEQFKEALHNRIIKKGNEELYRALELDRDEQALEILLEIKRDVSKGKSYVDEDKLISNQQNKFQNDKKGTYCDIWNQTMFLQHKNPGRTVRLCDAFVVPNYHMHQHKIEHNENDTLESFIDKFINYQSRATMLITGVPGIGKSSIISWLANKYKENDRVIILRFRDWEKEELKGGILKAIKKTLKCNKMDLKHKTIILDGFDEIKLLGKREELLHGFFNDILDHDSFKCIVTSRSHYIQTEKFDNYIVLAPFDPKKIGQFYVKIKGTRLNGIISDENIDVYGIPVILYMAIMCGLDITKYSSKPEIYNRVFAKDGGIFDRFSFDEKAYSEGAQILRDSKNIKKYLTFLGETAFKLFKLNGSSLELQDGDIPILKFEQKSISIFEFPLKPLFENIEKVEFVHNSIYEYFVSEYIFACLSNAIKETREELADILGTILKDNSLSPEILEFLQYKIRQSKLNEMFDVVLDTFQIMLQDGMTYYVNERCKPIIPCEARIFDNILKLLRLWEIDYMKLDKSIRNYLLFRQERTGNILKEINLSIIDLRGIDLNNVFLVKANLFRADLRGTNLKGADLKGAILIGADLRGADLRETDLSGADLRETDLCGVDLREANLRGAKMGNADLSDANLAEADLRRANLNKVDLRGADLKGANIDEVKLSEADLRGADLDEIKLETACLDASIFDEEQIKYLEKKLYLQGTSIRIEKANKFISYVLKYCK